MAISNADKIRNAATMYGTGSKQHKAAMARFGTKKKTSSSTKRGGGSGQRRDSKGRYA